MPRHVLEQRGTYRWSAFAVWSLWSFARSFISCPQFSDSTKPRITSLKTSGGLLAPNKVWPSFSLKSDAGDEEVHSVPVIMSHLFVTLRPFNRKRAVLRLGHVSGRFVWNFADSDQFFQLLFVHFMPGNHKEHCFYIPFTPFSNGQHSRHGRFRCARAALPSPPSPYYIDFWRPQMWHFESGNMNSQRLRHEESDGFGPDAIGPLETLKIAVFRGKAPRVGLKLRFLVPEVTGKLGCESRDG